MAKVTNLNVNRDPQASGVSPNPPTGSRTPTITETLIAQGQERMDNFVVNFDQQRKREFVRARNKMLLLVGISLTAVLLYIFWGFPSWGGYIMKLRFRQIMTIAITGCAISFATMIFQAIVNNRIITPGIMGLDSLFVLMQTIVIFSVGSRTFNETSPIVHFLGSLAIMLLFSVGLFWVMFRKHNRNVFYILLLGIVFGTLFGSLTGFLQNLLSPGEFLFVADQSYASFSKLNTQVLWIAIGIFVLLCLWTIPLIKFLDVLALGQDHAVNLGINYHAKVKQLLIIVVAGVSLATATVGPMTFLGLIVMNVTIVLMKTTRYVILLPAASAIGVLTLVVAQTVVVRILESQTTVSIIINFFGGLYFLWLVFRELRKGA